MWEPRGKTPLLAVCGPTASGKTGLAVELARALDGEVISCDSMQIYKGMDVATAKPSREEMQGVPHHLLDFLEPDAEFSVADYAGLARRAVAEVAGRGRLPIVAGGTGLYLQALTDNVQFEEISTDGEARRQLEREADEKGMEHMWKALAQADPALAGRLHPNNRGRILRGLEVYRLTGKTMTELQAQSRKEPPAYEICMLGLDYADRSVLYERINRRVDQMLEQGLLEEARLFRQRDCSKTAVQAIGYKELEPYFTGDATLDEAVEHLKMQTRRYAKRQLTWLRREERIHWLYVDKLPREALLEEALRTVGRSGILHRLEGKKGGQQ